MAGPVADHPSSSHPAWEKAKDSLFARGMTKSRWDNLVG